MEKKKSSLNFGKNKEDPSLQLYRFYQESHDRELKVQRHLLAEDELSGWLTPDKSPKILATKKKKNKRGQDNYAERKPVCSYQEGVWLDSVEKYTYRYVPNNGCYRAIKTRSNQPKLNQQRKSSPSIKNISTVSPEQKSLQYEISKDLRRQFRTLVETNNLHFKFRKPKPSSAVSDCLEDEEDYKAKFLQTSKPTAPANPIRKSTLTIPNDAQRVFETQSAQPGPEGSKLEDLLINKRCSTNLDNLTSSEPHNPGLAPPDKSWIKADKPHSKSVPVLQSHFNRMHVASTDEVEALAYKTFANRGGPLESLRASRSLGPIEKVTPSMREAYDNMQATREIMKLGSFAQTEPMNIASLTSNRRGIEQHHSDLVYKSKSMVPVKSTASLGPGVTSNFRSAKLSESQFRPKLNEMINVDMDNATSTFQAFLPSISGKRITTKISSLR